MKTITLVEARKKLERLKVRNIFSTFTSNESPNSMDDILYLTEAIGTASNTSLLRELYTKRDKFRAEMEYYDPSSAVKFYKEGIPDEIIKEARASFKVAKEDFDLISEKINTLEESIEIEIK